MQNLLETTIFTENTTESFPVLSYNFPKKDFCSS